MIARKAVFGNLGCIAIGAALVLLSGCTPSESSLEPGTVARSAANPAPAVRADVPAAAGRTASVGKARAPVQVAFDRKEGLEPGTSEQIEVTLLPQAALDNLQVEFRGSEGLIVESGAHYSQPAGAAAGTPVLHRIVIAAPTAGRYRVSVVIATSIGGAPIARAVAIPVQIGEAEAAATVRAKSTSTVGSTGQRIKVLPAERRTR